jgi:hypothetical protein
VWFTLRWALGKASRPPLDLPIRRADGQLMGEVEIYAELVAGCVDNRPEPSLESLDVTGRHGEEGSSQF